MTRDARIPALVAACVLAIAPIAGQQKPPAPQGAVSGTLTDGATGAAVADAVVSLAPQPGTQLPSGYQARQITDAKGRFVFQGLPESGTYQITAAKYGYLDGGYGRDGSPTDPLRAVVISNGSWVGNLRVNIWTPGVISGTVRDENGDPVVGVFVRVLARIHVAGRDDLAAGPVAVTNDHGQYRLPGLIPGKYVVQVPSVQMSVPASTRVPAAATNAPEGAMDVDDTARLVIGRYPLPPPRQNGRAMAYSIAFHPNGSTPSVASTIELRFGDDRPGVDITLTPVPATRVSGVVEGPTEALTGMTLRLLPAGMENLGHGSEAATALVGADGTFTFLNVPAGEYWLDAPVTFNQFSMASGATSTGGFVGSRGVTLPPPPPRGSWSSSGQQIAGSPELTFSTTDFRGAVGGTQVPAYTARMSITVGASDITNLAVRLRQNAKVSGRLVAELDPSKPPTQQALRFQVFLDPAEGKPHLGRPGGMAGMTAADQAFQLTGVQPGEYFVRAQSGIGWLVKSVEWRGRDYTTTPIDAASTDDISGVVVTVTNATPTLTGAVRTQEGSKPESAIVVVFPVQPSMLINTGLWTNRLTSVSVSADGTYRFTMVPAGEYLVAAISRAQRATWRDPEFLTTLERSATRVTLAWGQTSTQDLTVAVVR